MSQNPPNRASTYSKKSYQKQTTAQIHKQVFVSPPKQIKTVKSRIENNQKFIEEEKKEKPKNFKSQIFQGSLENEEQSKQKWSKWKRTSSKEGNTSSQNLSVPYKQIDSKINEFEDQKQKQKSRKSQVCVEEMYEEIKQIIPPSQQILERKLHISNSSLPIEVITGQKAEKTDEQLKKRQGGEFHEVFLRHIQQRQQKLENNTKYQKQKLELIKNIEEKKRKWHHTQHLLKEKALQKGLAEKQNSALKIKVKQLQNKLKRMQSEIHNAQSTFDGEKKMNEIQNRFNDFIKQTQERNEKQSFQLRHKISELNRLSDALLKQKENQIEEIRKNFNKKLEEEKVNLKMKQNKCEKQLQMLKKQRESEVKSYKEIIEDLNKEKEEKKLKIQQLEHEGEKKHRKIDKLQNQIQKNNQTNKIAEEQRLVFEKKITCQENQIRQFAYKLRQSNRKLEEQEDLTKQLKGRISKLQEESDILGEKVEKYDSLMEFIEEQFNKKEGSHLSRSLTDKNKLEYIIEGEKRKNQAYEKGIKKIVDLFQDIYEPFEEIVPQFDNIICNKIQQERKEAMEKARELRYKVEQSENKKKQFKKKLLNHEQTMEELRNKIQELEESERNHGQEKASIVKRFENLQNRYKEVEVSTCELLNDKIFKGKEKARNFNEIQQILFNQEDSKVFKTSQILRNANHDKIDWLIKKVVYGVEPTSTIRSTKLVFKSDRCNRSLGKLLEEEHLIHFLILCKTKSNFIFGAYAQAVSREPNDNFPAVIFSLTKEEKFPKAIRKDKDFRPIYVNEQKMIIFGLGELKITTNMEIRHTETSHGYYGSMNQKMLFGEEFETKLQLEEMQVHELDLK